MTKQRHTSQPNGCEVTMVTHRNIVIEQVTVSVGSLNRRPIQPQPLESWNVNRMEMQQEIEKRGATGACKANELVVN